MPHRRVRSQKILCQATFSSKVTYPWKGLAVAHLLIDDHVGSGKPIIQGLSGWANQQAYDV